MSATPPTEAPLSGLRVIDAATMVMVPSAAVVMADFGADVIKVEPPQGDLNRVGHLIPGMPTLDFEYCFFQDNRNKRSLALDLRHPRGRDAMHRLVRDADVFFTNTRARALERLGLDWETLRTINPRLIYAHGTGYGDLGQEANKPGYDAVCYWSRSGLENTMFPVEGWLGPIPYGSGDHPTGMALLAAVMIALYRRDRTGEGCRVTTSLLASGAWSNATVIQARLLGATFHPKRPRHDPLNFAAVYYLSADQRPFKFTIIDHDAGWPKLCRAAGLTELIDDPRYATKVARAQVNGELVAHLDGSFAAHDLDHWRHRFEAHDVPFSILSTYDDIVEDEQMVENDVFVEIEDERRGRVRTVNTPIALDGCAKETPRRAPRLGEHSRDVLTEAGFTAEDIASMVAEGVVR
ncbi:MAG TPA: CoA transferase [Thermoanaerobaculia bacterium]|nr:CoA transferase [Thermoanaerobaculia bacterium]